MGGAVERSAKTRRRKDLRTGAGKKRSLKRKEDSARSPHLVIGTVAWAGIVDGKIDTWLEDKQLSIWSARGKARRRYQCVRKVTIVVLPASRSGRARA